MIKNSSVFDGFFSLSS